MFPTWRGSREVVSLSLFLSSIFQFCPCMPKKKPPINAAFVRQNGNNMAREIIIEFFDYDKRIVVHRMEFKFLTPCYGRAYAYAMRLMNEYNIKGWFNIRAYDPK